MSSNSDILVFVFLRGGCDGLNFVGPSADANYLTERRAESRVERDGDHPGLVLKNTFADADFRFHFKANTLKQLYDDKHLAIVHACGLDNGTRSHFEAQDYIERGTPDDRNTSTGWLTRFAREQKMQGKIPIVAISNTTPISLLACSDAVAVPSARKIQLQGNPHYKLIQEQFLKQAYQGNSAVDVNGLRTLDIIDIMAKQIPYDAHGKQLDYTPSPKANYPTDGYANELSNAFKSLAQIIKMDVGVRIATLDFGGWDTHVAQGGRFPNLVDTVSRSMGAFWEDMNSYNDRITVVVMSEFGRRLKSNDSGGTDHGHGNMMLVMGGNVNGGNIYGRWPGLANNQLDNQVDLAVTTDYRTVLSEIAMKRFHQRQMSSIFPKFQVPAPLGIIKA